MVASRFAGSLSSVGIPAHFVHAAEWIHGDLGDSRGWGVRCVCYNVCIVQVRLWQGVMW